MKTNHTVRSDEPERLNREVAHRVLPAREAGETLRDYIERIDRATDGIRIHPPID